MFILASGINDKKLKCALLLYQPSRLIRETQLITKPRKQSLEKISRKIDDMPFINFSKRKKK